MLLFLVAVLFSWLIGVGVNHSGPEYLPPNVTSLLNQMGDLGAGLFTVAVVLGSLAVVYWLPGALHGGRAKRNRPPADRQGEELIALADRWNVAQQCAREAYGQKLAAADVERLQALVGYGWHATGAMDVKALCLVRGDKTRLFVPDER